MQSDSRHWQKLRKTDSLTPSEYVHQWEMSPSGRYGLDVNFEECPTAQRFPDTYYYTYRFTVLDLVSNTTQLYTSIVGPMKLLHSFYWLSDSLAVTVSFSRREGTVRQKILLFNHETKEVDCQYVRLSDMPIDYTSHHDVNSAPIRVGGQDHFLVCGSCDENWRLMFCRLLPWNPFEKSVLEETKFVVDRAAILGEQHRGHEPQLHDHPISFGSRLYFLCSVGADSSEVFFTRQIALDMVAYVDVEEMLELGVRVIGPGHVKVERLQATGTFRWLMDMFNYRICTKNEKICLWDRRSIKGCRERFVAILDLETKRFRCDLVNGITGASFLNFGPTGSLWMFGQSSKKAIRKRKGVKGWATVKSIGNFSPPSLHKIAKNSCFAAKGMPLHDRELMVQF